VTQEDDFFTIRLDLKKDAKRFEPGSLNIPGIYALGASLELLFEVGVARVFEKICRINDQLFQGLKDRNVDVVSSMASHERSGILTFIPPYDPENLFRFFNQNQISLSLRGRMIRLSPHFYNNADDVERFFQTLDAFKN
jgi:selenocysteine lyase/cysteine desulfurase